MEKNQEDVGKLFFDLGDFFDGVQYCFRSEKPCETIVENLRKLYEKWQQAEGQG